MKKTKHKEKKFLKTNKIKVVRIMKNNKTHKQ